MHVGTTARRHVIALSCSRADVQTCIAGYRSGGLWNAAPRRHRRTSGNRHDRGSGAAARRAGDPPARAGHVSLPHAARAEPSNGSRRCCRRGSTQNPTLVMVTLLGVVPQARFNPEELNVTSRGRLFRPIGIVPLSPAWSSFQLDARRQAAALYLFEPGISFAEQLTVSYQGL